MFADEMKLHVLRPRGMTNATVAGGPAPGPEERELLVMEYNGDINQVRLGMMMKCGCMFCCVSDPRCLVPSPAKQAWQYFQPDAPAPPPELLVLAWDGEQIHGACPADPG